jgi:PAS domain S-box-containing protein
MPLMNGADMIKEIRKVDNLIPAIVLSAHDETEYIIDSIRRGVSSYLNKPIDVDELLKSVYEALNSNERVFDRIYNDEIVLEKYNSNINPTSIVTIFDINGIVLYVNESFAYMFGFPKEELIGKPYYTLSKEKHDDELIEDIWETIRIKKEIWSGTIRYVNNFDEVYFLRGTISPILDEQNNILEFVAIREDVTSLVHQELKKYEENI